MENASRALMIAAGVLVGLLILSLAVYLVQIFGDYAADMQSEIAENTLAQFNEKYMKYNGLNNLTIQDVVTVKNNALENNFSYSNYNLSQRAGDNNSFIDVFINGTWILGETDEELLKSELEDNGGSTRYSCVVQVNQNTGRVNRIIFRPN